MIFVAAAMLPRLRWMFQFKGTHFPVAIWVGPCMPDTSALYPSYLVFSTNERVHFTYVHTSSGSRKNLFRKNLRPRICAKMELLNSFWWIQRGRFSTIAFSLHGKVSCECPWSWAIFRTLFVEICIKLSDIVSNNMLASAHGEIVSMCTGTACF